MNILALDTSEQSCSVGLLVNSNSYTLQNNTPRQHTQNIWPMINEVLCQANTSIESLDYVACSAGPGSFTGLRVAGSVAQGIAVALNKPIIPISTLRCLALSVGQGLVWALMDARMDQLYSALYDFNNNAEVLPPQIINKDKVSEYNINNFTAVGSGWNKVSHHNACKVLLNAVDPGVLIQASINCKDSAVKAEDFRLLYLRNNVAY